MADESNTSWIVFNGEIFNYVELRPELEALGHQSKAVHRAYAKKAQVVISTLEDYEKRAAAASAIVPLPLQVACAS